MYKFSTGDKVRTKNDDSGLMVCGMVVGFGWVERSGGNSPVVMVELDMGGYIKNDKTNTYVGIVAVLPEYLEEM